MNELPTCSSQLSNPNGDAVATNQCESEKHPKLARDFPDSDIESRDCLMV